MILEPGPDEAYEVLRRVMAEFHPELAGREVRVSVLFAYPAEEDAGPALKLHGYPCAAIIKPTRAEVRLTGGPDAVLKVDGKRWRSWTEARRVALFDHELYHLEVKRDRDGQAGIYAEGRLYRVIDPAELGPPADANGQAA